MLLILLLPLCIKSNPNDIGIALFQPFVHKAKQLIVSGRQMDANLPGLYMTKNTGFDMLCGKKCAFVLPR